MSSESVRRVQELRRSSAAQPVAGKRFTGPNAQEWEFYEMDSDGISARPVVKPCADCDHREHKPGGERCQRRNCSCLIYVEKL